MLSHQLFPHFCFISGVLVLRHVRSGTDGQRSSMWFRLPIVLLRVECFVTAIGVKSRFLRICDVLDCLSFKGCSSQSSENTPLSSVDDKRILVTPPPYNKDPIRVIMWHSACTCDTPLCRFAMKMWQGCCSKRTCRIGASLQTHDVRNGAWTPQEHHLQSTYEGFQSRDPNGNSPVGSLGVGC